MNNNNKRIHKIPSQYQSKVKKSMADLVEAIVLERKNKNLSQEKFAEMINLSLKAYQSYEQGTRKPSFETLTLMFLALNLQLKIVKKN